MASKPSSPFGRFLSNPSSLTILPQDTFNTKDKDCPICHDNIRDTIVETACNHSFHKECLTTWLRQLHCQGHKGTCPCCRRVFFEASMPAQSSDDWILEAMQSQDEPPWGLSPELSSLLQDAVFNSLVNYREVSPGMAQSTEHGVMELDIAQVWAARAARQQAVVNAEGQQIHTELHLSSESRPASSTTSSSSNGGSSSGSGSTAQSSGAPDGGDVEGRVDSPRFTERTLELSTSNDFEEISSSQTYTTIEQAVTEAESLLTDSFADPCPFILSFFCSLLDLIVDYIVQSGVGSIA